MLALWFSSLFFLAVKGAHIPRYAQIIGRGAPLNSSYDFVIIGGGTSGLTVAARLTEDPSVSVIVIEYGFLDNQEPEILVPGLLDYAQYSFNITSTPQRGLGERSFPIPAAAVVGGGTTINGMFFDRGSASDYDAWVQLGNPGWGWDDLLPYFKKSETFTPPEDLDFADEFSIKWEDSPHGFDGPVQSSYPRFQYPANKIIFRAWQELGIQVPSDPTNGNKSGVFWSSSSLDPKDETRSYARTAYYSGVPETRPNYHLLTGQVVSKITFDGKKATGVEFICRETKKLRTVKAKSEVVLAAGALHSPQILQLSGVGPASFLDSLGIEVVVDLPGVGQNFQDHPTLYSAYSYNKTLLPNDRSLQTNATFASEQLALYKNEGKGAYTICRNSGNTVSFLPLRQATSSYQSIIDLGKSQSPDGAVIPNDTDPSIRAGYQAQRALILDLYAANSTSALEYAFSDGAVLPLTVVKPLSRGTIYINSTDPLEPPQADWNALSDPVDLEILIAGVRILRDLMATEAMIELGPTELAPGANLMTDKDIGEALRQQAQPTYSHLTSTCSMMKREYGGVVDPTLQVYGVEGLSVVDSSIMPLIPTAHTSATVYAVAEKAADIIKLRHLQNQKQKQQEYYYVWDFDEVE